MNREELRQFMMKPVYIPLTRIYLWQMTNHSTYEPLLPYYSLTYYFFLEDLC